MANILEFIIKATDQASKVVASIESKISGSTGKIKASWQTVSAGIQSVDKKFNTLRATGSQALGILQDGWNMLIEPGLEAARVMAQTESVIKSTGGAAGVTAGEIKDMAGVLERMTGVNGDAVQSGQNMLLTFTNIGANVFPRVTQAMTDMSVSMAEGDVQAADFRGTAMQLGKALNDPVQGINALSRAGVSFTDVQKDTIKQMVEMNDIAGAQAIILAELEKEFGGAAKAAGDTLPGKMAKAQNAIGEFQENIANVFIPIMGEAADAFNTLTTGNQQLADALTGTQAKMKADLRAGKMTLNDYNNGIKGMAQNVAAWDVATGLALANQYTMTQAQLDQEVALQASTDGTQAMADVLYGEYIPAVDASRSAGDDLVESILNEEAGMKRANDAAHDLALEGYALLKVSMAGLISKELTQFNDKQDELKTKAQELSTTIATSYGKIKADATADLAGVNAELATNAAAHEDATRRILFGYAEQNLAIGGLTDVEMKALDALAVKWNLKSKEDIAAMEAIRQAGENLANDGNIDRYAENVAGQFGSLREALAFYKGDLASIPAEIVTTLTLKAKMDELASQLGSAYFIPTRDSGGSVNVGVPYMIGAGVRETFVPQQAGVVLPPSITTQITNNITTDRMGVALAMARAQQMAAEARM